MENAWIVLVSVSAGWVLSVCTPSVTRWLSQKRRRRALALLVCPVLEQFMLACQSAINDEGHWRKDIRHPRVPMPTGPQFSDELDWTAIDPSLAHRILSLQAAITRAEQELDYIAEEVSDPPDHEYWFLSRRKRCLKLQQDASELSMALRKVARISETTDEPLDGIQG